MTIDIASGFEEKLKIFRDQDDQRHEWMTIFSKELLDLRNKYQDALKDLQGEQIARRYKQEECEKWERKFGELNGSIERSSFVLVLIDADADTYIFNSKYLKVGTEGGRSAAYDLVTAVRQYLREAEPNLAELPIIFKAFAHADGLSDLLTRSRVISSPEGLRSFARGFSDFYPTGDFIFVSHGKDRVDHKLQGVLKQHVDNPACRHILFGGCHDNGYVRLLETYARDPSLAGRLTLIESFDKGREFSQLNLRYARLESIFQDDYLSSAKRAADTTANGSPKTVGPTYAALVKATTSDGGLDKLPKIDEIPKGAILVNGANQRLDSTLPVATDAAEHSMHRKTGVAGMRYCYMHHLRGECNASVGCTFSHGPLSESEKLVAKNRLRKQACKVGLSCVDPKCFYGHNCRCSGNSCRFSKLSHNVDVSTWKVKMIG